MARQSSCVVQIEKIKTNNVKTKGSLRHRFEHNLRVTHVPANVDKSLSKYNKELVSLNPHETYSSTFNRIISEKVAEGTMGPIRKNGVLAAELNISYTSPENLNMAPEEAARWGEDTVKWLKERFGEKNVIHAIMHYDEDVTYDESDSEFANPEKHPHPHIHAVVVPINEKGRLSFASFINGPYGEKSTSMLQTEYYEAVGKKYGMVRGTHKNKMKYEDVREYKKNVHSKRVQVQEDFTPLATERLPDGNLSPSYADRVQATAVKMHDQNKDLLDNARIEAATAEQLVWDKLNLKLKDLEEKMKKEYKKKEQDLEKREELLQKSKLAIRNLAKDGDAKALEKTLITYSAFNEGLKNHPDKELTERLKNEVVALAKWQHEKDKAVDKLLDEYDLNEETKEK